MLTPRDTLTEIVEEAYFGCPLLNGRYDPFDEAKERRLALRRIVDGLDVGRRLAHDGIEFEKGGFSFLYVKSG